MDAKNLGVLRSCPLFHGLSEEALFLLLQRGAFYAEEYPVSATVPFRNENGGRIGILLSGKAEVFSAEDERTLLNRLEPGSMFGVSTLYTGECADTVVMAASPLRILFLEEKDMDTIWDDPITRKNLISFLADRIRFLTEKIASFTAPCAEKKLCRYLLQKVDEEGRISSFRSYSELAKSLNLGRASLYRALEALEKKAFIQRSGKEIFIQDMEGLELYLTK